MCLTGGEQDASTHKELQLILLPHSNQSRHSDNDRLTKSFTGNKKTVWKMADWDPKSKHLVWKVTRNSFYRKKKTAQEEHFLRMMSCRQ